MLIAADVALILLLTLALVAAIGWRTLTVARDRPTPAGQARLQALEQQLRIAELERDNALLELYRREAESLAGGYHLPPFKVWRDHYRKETRHDP